MLDQGLRHGGDAMNDTQRIHAFVEQANELFRLWVLEEDPRTAGEMHDALCEVHNDYLHATDPDWKRPSCLGNGPSRGAVKMLAMVRGMGGGE